MSRPVTLFTGQWADLPLETLAEKAAEWGFDGLELACWGDHMDVAKAADDLDYCARQKATLHKHNLDLYAISNHLRTTIRDRTASRRTIARATPRKSASGPSRP
jgi:sugar phosphate isomerase/epimerase